jgi:hypothetical protein
MSWAVPWRKPGAGMRESAMQPRYEIVRILDNDSLIDAESYERRYRTREGMPLAPGYYVVLWEDGVEAPGFDESATYVGPYKSAWHATTTLFE